jgi:hypothetical protein
VIGRQLATVASQPPNWMSTLPSAFLAAVMLFNEYAFCGLAVKYPSLL